MTIHPFWVALITLLLDDKAPVKVPNGYSNYANFFSSKVTVKLFNYTEINNHAIDRKWDKQPPYWLIHSLKPVELETLKANIETNLKNDFIWPSKSPAVTPILFAQKPDGSLRLVIDYRELNNPIIKN